MPVDPDILDLRRQIVANCHRSDARFAGSLSLCGLLLRLRDLFRWEKGHSPWEEIETSEVLSWIEDRENLWEESLEEEIQPLAWAGRTVDPFEDTFINQALIPRGWFYGAGYAFFMKPIFFLGRIRRTEMIGDIKVFYLGDEIARDLFAVPAQARSREIVARHRPLAAYLWGTVIDGGASRQKALDMALAEYGLDRRTILGPPKDWQDRFSLLVDREMETVVRHETGELEDDTFPEGTWQALVGDHPHSRIELIARTIKDLLADTGDQGRLAFIIAQQRQASLGIMVAQHDGLAARIFFELDEAFGEFAKMDDWALIEEARIAGYQKARNMAGTLLDLKQRSRGHSVDWLTRRVDQVFFEPLGL